MDLELLKDLVKEHNEHNNAEKLDYIKNLESIKAKLRTKLKEQSCESLGQWFLDDKKDKFYTTPNVSYIFEPKLIHTYKHYLHTYEKKQQEKIKDKFDLLRKIDKECINIQREVVTPQASYTVLEKITYVKEFKLFVGAIQDLTQINLIKKNIQNIDKALHALMNVFDKNVILIQCSLDGKINYVSSAFCETSQYTDSMILDRNLCEFQDTKKSKSILDIFTKSIEQNKTAECELKFLKKDGNFFWVKAFISPILNTDANVTFTLICHDITSHKLLETITYHDALTGVFNRRYYSEMIHKEINRCKRDHKKLSFAMIDIDYFKQYNDIYGHREGDEVLKQVASTLDKNLKRGGDHLFRMGGEEFCAIFTGDEEMALALCETLREGIENLQIPHVGNRVSRYVTVSIGLVVADLQSDVIDELGLYTTSDNALYSAKSQGRNRVFVHTNSDIEIF